MPSRRDNAEERLNRIAALMEEYRVNHEDLVEYVKAVQNRALNAKVISQHGMKAARDGFKRNKKLT
jgi:DNA repair ATPase RecN